MEREGESETEPGRERCVEEVESESWAKPKAKEFRESWEAAEWLRKRFRNTSVYLDIFLWWSWLMPWLYFVAHVPTINGMYLSSVTKLDICSLAIQTFLVQCLSCWTPQSLTAKRGSQGWEDLTVRRLICQLLYCKTVLQNYRVH